jgi:glycosyltransferase involved in cell wall biosynthesis
MADVTVLMANYNGMPYLVDAVESIQRQTLSDWLLLIVNDGSTDGSADYLNQLTDPRIRVVDQSNQGLAAALNLGLQLCDTEFLARQDSDDVSLPTRLEKQVAFLKSRPRVGLVGTQHDWLFGERAGGGGPLPCDHASIDAALMRGNHAVCHGSMMCRTDALRRAGGYWATGISEDWDMFLRLSEHTELANLNEVLLHVRILESGIQSRQMTETRARMIFACEAARRRRQHLQPISYDEFLARQRNQPWWRRAHDWLEVHARTQYRKAQPEILGRRPALGYARLAWAAACSPKLTWQRIRRELRKRHASEGVA